MCIVCSIFFSHKYGGHFELITYIIQIYHVLYYWKLPIVSVCTKIKSSLITYYIFKTVIGINTENSRIKNLIISNIINQNSMK